MGVVERAKANIRIRIRIILNYKSQSVERDLRD